MSTIITVAFTPLTSHDIYELQWKEYPQKWEIDGKSKTINAKEVSKNRNNKIQANIEDLNPGTTYTVRLRVLRVVGSGVGGSATPGKPSPELIIDTEAVSCTPKASQCIIL
ncbi:hypothetical protein ACHAXA_004512 [Cyclostephanos tholiformis]|uniref:Fibronectin type-III domain-containing protein n=1 Tax=Cyclostephanos tholiformis TaxID=382380 RepID=A0ABD3RDW2_9STRA